MFRSLLVFVLLSPYIASFGCTNEPFQPRRETRGRYTVVWLQGTPYEMGFQHGQLLKDELRQGVEEVEKNLLLKGMFVLAKDLGLVQLALDNSYPEMIEECEGLRDGLGDVGWTMDHCMVLNFGDVLTEFMRFGMPEAEDLAPGCTQLAASGPATKDGRLYHGRVLDWSKIDFIVDYPVIFVRRPAGGIPHAVIGFPGNLSPYQGINAEGIAVASNEVHPLDSTVNDRKGRSHVQMVSQILTRARSLSDARGIVTGANHMSLELLMVSDGETDEAEVFEMSPQQVELLGMKDGIVYTTNHFVGEKTAPLDREEPENSNHRFGRLAQLLPRGAPESVHGSLAPEIVIKVMRDRKNSITGEISPADAFEDGQSIATNGALYQLVFDPADLTFWVAAGALPVPAQPFTGFSLGELLGMAGHGAPDPIP